MDTSHSHCPDILNVYFRLRKGLCTFGIMNTFLVWLKRTLIQFCQLCLAIYIRSPKNTGIRMYFLLFSLLKCLYVLRISFRFKSFWFVGHKHHVKRMHLCIWQCMRIALSAQNCKRWIIDTATWKMCFEMIYYCIYIVIKS